MKEAGMPIMKTIKAVNIKILEMDQKKGSLEPGY
jgi:hypothetical protein